MKGMIILMFYGIQLVRILGIALGVCAILCGIRSFLRKREDNVDDDLGYLERIYEEKAGR